MYKLIAIDLDGTLLNTYGEISEETKKVIHKCKSTGIVVVIASGRTVDSIRNSADELNLTDYIIGINGAIVANLKNNTILYEKFISKSKALNIINICEENSITYSVYTNKTIISRYLKHNVLYYYNSNLKKSANKKTSITLVQDVYEYVKNMQDDENVMKIFVSDNTKSVFNAIIRKISKIPDIEILDVSHMSRKIITNGTEDVPIEYYYTEISEKNVDKWSALEFLIKKIGIDKKDVIAIGDNENDIKMISNSGLGIAMKNSSPKIQSNSNLVTEFDNDHDGVARVIESII